MAMARPPKSTARTPAARQASIAVRITRMSAAVISSATVCADPGAISIVPDPLALRGEGVVARAKSAPDRDRLEEGLECLLGRRLSLDRDAALQVLPLARPARPEAP